MYSKLRQNTVQRGICTWQRIGFDLIWYIVEKTIRLHKSYLPDGDQRVQSCVLNYVILTVRLACRKDYDQSSYSYGSCPRYRAATAVDGVADA